MTPEDRDLAIRAMLSEAGREGPEGMGAVAEVILNRATAGRYGGKSLRDVVLAKGQFEPFMPHVRGKANDPYRFSPDSPEYKEAAFILDAVASGKLPSLTNGATHFYSPKSQAALGRAAPSWAKGEGRAIRNHTFYSPEGKVNYDPSQWDAISRSQTPTQIQPPKPVAGMLPTPSAPAAPSTPQFGQTSPAPTGNLLGRMFGGDASRKPQSWADVFAGAGPQSPLLFRALSYGMQPSPGSGGPLANAGAGPSSATPPAPPQPGAGNPPFSLPTPTASGAATGGSGPQLPGILGLFQNALSGGGLSPNSAGAPMSLPSSGSPGMGGGFNPISLLGNLFKMI